MSDSRAWKQDKQLIFKLWRQYRKTWTEDDFTARFVEVHRYMTEIKGFPAKGEP